MVMKNMLGLLLWHADCMGQLILGGTPHGSFLYFVYGKSLVFNSTDFSTESSFEALETCLLLLTYFQLNILYLAASIILETLQAFLPVHQGLAQCNSCIMEFCDAHIMGSLPLDNALLWNSLAR
jgi:hypothetical protein